MAKLSEAMVAGLRSVRAGASCEVHARTLAALRSRFLIKPDGDWYGLTTSGRTLLDEYERAEAKEAERLERASRPVPASAFVEPAARTAPVWGGDYDEPEDEPAVPRAWVDQLVTLLDSGVRVTRWSDPERWVAVFPRSALALGEMLDAGRLDAAATEAIRLGIAEALPPTPGGGVVRLALVKH